MELLLIDTVTEEGEITVVLSIVKRMRSNRHDMPAGGENTGELKKRYYTRPLGMSRRGGKH
jgi:hypothetical protein